jgi:hypothetical protein
VLFGVFIIVFALGIFLLKSPASPLKPVQTPAATSMPNLVSGWNAQDVSLLELKRAVGGVTHIERKPDGSWQVNTNGKTGTATAGSTDQLVAEVLALRRMVDLPSDVSLPSLYLEKPGQTITIGGVGGKTLTIKVGGTTPTQSGYYVVVGNSAPAVVDKTAVETIFNLFDTALPEPTPAPGGTGTPEPTPTS